MPRLFDRCWIWKRGSGSLTKLGLIVGSVIQSVPAIDQIGYCLLCSLIGLS